MNIIECIDRNTFLKEIFPSGLGSDLLIGPIELRFDAEFTMAIHTSLKPAKEVSKWGTWGKNYNRVVIELLGAGLGVFDLQNWSRFDRAAIACTKENRKIWISQKAGDWSLKLSCDGLIFQRCSTYVS
jgi:hypothetical protein